MIMRKEDILSKGLYVHSQVSDLVCVKQYIIAKFKNKKALFLRFVNEREETATAMTLRIRQYNVRGEFICAETIEVKHLKAAPGSEFTVKNPMIVKDACVDFRVDIINVAYGDYTYDVIDGEAHVRFAKVEQEAKKSINTNQLRLALDGKSQQVVVRSLKAPTLLIMVCCVLLLSLLCFSIGQLAYYMYTETCFTLDNFEYEFLTDNKDDGPIRLTKYKGFALNLIIPAEIEGYEIASVANTAFARTSLRSIVLEGNTTIEDGAFEGCKKLHTVSIANVEKIGDNAFKGCKALKNLTLGDSLKEIGDYAFSGCAALESVKLGEGLLSVGEFAFESCSGISELIIPSTVETIGYGVVSGCNINTLSVPFVGSSEDNLGSLCYLYGVYDNSEVRSALTNLTVTNQTVIPDGTFENCVTLRNVDFKLPVTSIGNNAFKGCKRINTFEIDETVQYIGVNAFYECIMIDGIVLPEGIERIEEGSFYGCENLSSIVIPNSVKTVGMDAFKLCTSLKTLTVPKTVTRLEKGAFADCTSLVEVTIPFIGYSSIESASMRAVFGDAGAESIQTVSLTGSGSICNGAFANMTSLKRVYLNAKITSIGEDAFSGCTSLAKVTMSDNVSYIGDRAFLNCASLDNLNLPETLGYMGERVFEGCASLSDVTIPEKVTEIKAYAFAGCASLSDVIWHDAIEDIGEGAFKDCSSLMAINIPAGVTSIKNNTFENCATLSLVAISTDVTSIGERAFAGCSSLQGIALPGALERIESEAFADCTMLGAFVLPTSVTELGSGILSGCTALDTLTVHFMSESFSEDRLSGNIGYLFDSDDADNSLTPESLKTVNLVDIAVITEGAFTGCAGLYTVNLPQSLTDIDGGAFEGSGIVSIIIPEGVTVIEESTFADCERLSSVTFPRHLVTIEKNAFSGCLELESVKLYNTVESIGESAFYGCESLVSVEIPDSVEAIGKSALEGCVSLKTLVIPFVGSARDTNENMSYLLGESVASLKKITVTDSDQLPECAFMGLSTVEEIILPREMYTVGDYAFSGCSSLKSLEIPSTVTYLGEYSLEGCVSLEKLTVPFVGVRRDESTGIMMLFNSMPSDTLKEVTITQTDSIPDNCFEGCEYIEKIVIDTYVESIGAYAFSGCSSLSEITLPDTVESIGDYAFSDCKMIRSIVLPENLTYLSTLGTFENCYKLFEIYNHSTAITVQPGEGAPGHVAYYALNVYVGEEKPVKMLVEGFEFLKQNGGNAWYLINYTVDENGGCTIPSEFNHNGLTVNTYSIPAYMFYMDETLVDLTLSGSVVGIGQHAFAGCVNLVTADISAARISDIPTNAFADCGSLSQMTIPYNVTNILDGAFRNCTSLERVEFPESLIYIGSEAFMYCDKLNWVKVQEYVWSIGENAFYGCVSLDHVYNLSALNIEAGTTDNGYVAYYALLVDSDQIAENLHIVEVGELVFKKSEDRWFLVGHNSTDGILELMPFDYQNKYVDSFVIVNEAFKNDESISRVVFSDAVKRIGIDAFAGCSNLAEVDFSLSNTLQLSDINWITGLQSIENIAFPTTLTEFPSDVISSFSNLKTVSFVGNGHITSIPSWAFETNRTSLKTVVLPDFLETIENEAFYNCSNLENITLPNTVITIGDSAFRYCRSLESVELSDSLESIGEYAFEDCAIESLTLKGNVSSLGYAAFKDCSSMKTADLSASTALTVISDYAFIGCSALQTVNLPTKLDQIGTYSFSGCQSLTRLSTPSTLNSIGIYAFNDCNALSSVTLNEGLYSIGSGAFSYCSSLKSITVPSSVTAISDSTFYYSGLESVTLLYCESIGSSAFEGCGELVNVNFSYNLATIGYRAFANCYGLTSLDLSYYSYLENIDGYAFADCTSLKSVDLSDCYGLTSLSYGAFSGCTALEALDLNDSSVLVAIGEDAFAGCSSLESVDLSGCTSLQSINSYAFNGCSSLEQLTITGCTELEYIGTSAFYGCSALKELDLSILSGLSSIDYSCFNGCTALESVSFPSSLTYIGEYAFNGCEALKAVDLSVCTNLTSISNSAFRSCKALEYLVFPARLSSIESYAFYGCSALKPIRIPATLSGYNIGSYAFYGCEGLYEIWCESPRSDLTLGSPSTGYIAYYAIVIHYSYSEPALTFYELSQNNITYRFAYDKAIAGGTDQRYLIGAEGYDGNGLFKFPDTTGYTYTVSRFLANDVRFSSAYVPMSVQGFESGYVDNWGYPTIYYAGNSDVFGVRYSSYFYTYDTCKHQSGNTWYGTSDNPLTEVCETKEVETKAPSCTEEGNVNVLCVRCNELLYSYVESILPHDIDYRETLAPTCTEYGKGEYFCKECGTITETTVIEKLPHQTVGVVNTPASCEQTGVLDVYCELCDGLIATEVIPKDPHDYDENNKCRVCGIEVSDSQRLLEECLSLESSTGYSFAINSAGEYISGNKNLHSTVSEMTFTASCDMTMTLVYSVSSESGWDKFKIDHNGTMIEKSGTVTREEMVLNLMAGDVVKFTYSKDSSANYGDGVATIHSIVLTINNQ